MTTLTLEDMQIATLEEARKIFNGLVNEVTNENPAKADAIQDAIGVDGMALHKDADGTFRSLPEMLMRTGGVTRVRRMLQNAI
jgi:hypothetical protein